MELHPFHTYLQVRLDEESSVWHTTYDITDETADFVAILEADKNLRRTRYGHEIVAINEEW
jgi:hypothetical protein